METHVHSFCVILLHIVSYDRMSSGIVSLHNGPELAVSHFIEALSGWNSFSSIDIHGSNFYFCRRGHYFFMILGGKETSLEMKKCPPARLLALDSLRYYALLWTAKTMSDAS